MGERRETLPPDLTIPSIPGKRKEFAVDPSLEGLGPTGEQILGGSSGWDNSYANY